jgi:peptidoglycan/xylan/chitin deacetylase (PgdA/CDA1 family)
VTLEYFPVLAYHKISPHKEFGLTTIHPEIFEKHLQLIHKSGFTPLTFIDLHANPELPDKPVIITFDDGYESLYQYALPILNNYGLKAVIYVLSDYIGRINNWEAYKIQRRHRHLNVDQIQKLVDSGFEIGSHGKSHSYLPALNNYQLKQELEVSKKEISDITGRDIISFCYPYGVSNMQIEENVKKSGYRFAVGNLELGSIKTHRDFHIGRRSIYATDTLRVFEQKLQKPSLSHTSVFTERVIRSGASATILKKILTNKLN